MNSYIYTFQSNFRYLIGGFCCLMCASVFLVSCGNRESLPADYEVIPLPQNISPAEGHPFIPDGNTVIVYDSGDGKAERTACFLSDFLKERTGYSMQVTDRLPDRNFIRLTLGGDKQTPESYTLTVFDSDILIEGADEAGIFYGMQTLCKSLPVTEGKVRPQFPQVRIADAPRFHYRGMMLDVCRHFYGIDFVKKYIDLLALHNINYFHWHLTDDQGWRLPIKKYPKLTEIGSQRRQTIVGMSDSQFDGVPHGGCYTREEIKEVVDYAAERFISVIPEIDIPGHTLSVLASYPDLGCTGGPYEVCDRWGVFDDVLCAGNEAVYTFLQDVLEEVTELFPAPYVHIGGDECPKTKWKTCPKCQARISALGLKTDKKSSAEDKLQSYMMTRIEKFLNGKGKRIIGWDEVLQGGVSPTTTVMSWQGIQGGITAARLHHDVIMAPNTHLYFDYFQTTETDSLPYAYPGYNPIERIYWFDPVPAELSEDEKGYIKGVQANLWTEFIADSCQIERMVLPRMGALAEIQWTSGQEKDYSGFLKRLYKLSRLYGWKGYRYSTVPFDVQAEFKSDTLNNRLLLQLSVFDSIPVHYTLDGSTPTAQSRLYTAPITIDSTVQLRARGIGKERQTEVYGKNIDFNEATLKPVTLLVPALPYFASDPKGSALVDGQRGNKILYRGDRWTGFAGKMSVVIDLKEETDISNITAGILQVPYKGDVKYTCSYSPDNVSYQVLTDESRTVEQYTNLSADFDRTKARYVKIEIEKQTPGLIVCDEIMIRK